MQPLTKKQTSHVDSICETWHVLHNLFSDDKNKSTDEAYVAIPVHPRQALTKLILIKNTYPNYNTFLDVGCGKGSAMFFAKMSGFDVVKGIELRQKYEEQLKALYPYTCIMIGDAFKVLKTFKIEERSVVFMFRPIPNSKLMEKLTTLVISKAPKGTIFYFVGCNFTCTKKLKLLDYEIYIKL